MINEDGTANVQVEAVNTSRPSEQHDVIIVLRKVEGEWTLTQVTVDDGTS